MDKNAAVYICTGCGIGDALDIDQLSGIASDEGKIPSVKAHPFLCGKEGVDLIKGDIEAGVNTVIIGACSPRVNYDVFNFGADKIVDRVNLREHVAWSHEPKAEATQMLAEDYIRMACAKLEKTEVPIPFKSEEEYSKDILVVGGGVAGMTAALEAAKAGYKAFIVEKEEKLGGFLSKMKKLVTAPYKDLADTGADELIKSVSENTNIKVFTSATVEKISGGPGLFSVDIKANGNSTSVRAGAVVQATGWVPYDANKLGHLGYGKLKDVITNVEMEQMAAAGKIKRPSDGADVKNVLFIQCAGSRDPEHLPYCSSVCCLTSLKQATYVKEQDPEAVNYILYKDVRTVGQAEDFYRKAQRDGNIFIRGAVKNIGQAGDKLFVEADDELLGEPIKIEELDLVVLAVGMVPASKPEVAPRIKAPSDSKDADAEGMIQVKDDSGFFSNTALKLQYRQGPELPTLKYGFPDSHFICFPYETRRTGIYTAGCIRKPMEVARSKDDATGAAMKAIQCAEATAIGMAVHPRAGDMSYPEFNMSRCTQCKRCTEECPFGTLDEDVKGTPLPNPTRCRRCGICMGACPERIISFKNYSPNIVSQMIKGIEIPDEDEEKPRFLAFICENDALPALDMAAHKRLRLSPYIRFIPVRCLGSVNTVWIGDALSAGFDGVMLFGCKMGDDYQCHMVTGSQLADRRMINVQDKLKQLALEQERVHIEPIAIDEAEKLVKAVADFQEEMEGIGMNPFKGF